MLCCVNILPVPLQMCMGMCVHQDIREEAKKAKLQSSKIEQDLFEQARSEINVFKILILGAAESGKSTLIKQIKIIHSHGFSKQELISFKIHARSILSSSQCMGDDQELLPFVAHAFCALWADLGVRAAASRGYEFELNDSALYLQGSTPIYPTRIFGSDCVVIPLTSQGTERVPPLCEPSIETSTQLFFENMSRIIAPNYVPTERDVLRVRVRTCGIIETQFQVNDVIFRLYDVGGQRSERRKWLRCFDCIQAVLFVVALSSYDMSLPQEPTVNRLQESLELFTSLCSNALFNSTSVILFLNKTDLFQKKILHSGRHLRLYISSFKGADADVDSAAHHITAMFSACNSRADQPVFHHYTTATDTANVRVVFQMIIDQIFRQNLAAAQLL
ncbi:guanine nucleotide binding protein (G protein) alpha v1 isoform X1 [Nerophis lumbriciformis]|uniref:guanine nucleotide binding protein (G protein) alpha v1 isoform X1 n=1 Tax=Nerophis lumbriciformis TaxID=546530 RepID=UPI002ADF3E33|nr:guanine nucleotide-binding protein G(o) subunit alpha-like isoform X1 [Nerophis lumbriciformis]